MSKQRSQKPKIENALNGEVPSIVTQVLDGTDSESLPFPEWSDQEINLEKWDNIPSPKDRNTSQIRLSNIFEDPQEVHIPPSLGAHQWKRCAEIFSDIPLICGKKIFLKKYGQVISANECLVVTLRSFISSIETLLYISSIKECPEEYGSLGYYAPVDRAWRPWHHIYSNCKITKGHSDHTPLYNPMGKYVVRLYWMGSWRKIYVDDLIPIDKTDNVLLPSLHIPKVNIMQDLTETKSEKRSKDKTQGHVKKEIVELWPMILCKALLKIGSLSWSTQHELNDFDIINCLTGWVPQRIKIGDISSSDLWDIFMAYAERFEWDEGKEGSTKKTGSSKSKGKRTEKAEVTKKGTKGAKAAIPSGIENMPDGNRFIVVTCDIFELNVENTIIPKNIGVFISQVRNIPLIKPPPRPELEFWKTFRYEEWAVERGIIPPDIPKLNIQSLKIVDPFTRIRKITQDITDPDNKTEATLDTGNTDKKSEKSSKSLNIGQRERTPKHHLEPDPTMWIDFDEIRENMNHIIIYFQPRTFKTKAKISDINFLSKTADFKHIISPITSKEVRNDPIYLFMDSIDYKLLFINLIQTGNLLQLEKQIEVYTLQAARTLNRQEIYSLSTDGVDKRTNGPTRERYEKKVEEDLKNDGMVHTMQENIETEKAEFDNLFQELCHAPDIEPVTRTCPEEIRDICVDILQKKTEEKEKTRTNKSISEISNKSTLMCSFNTKAINLVLEEYCWEGNAQGESKGMIRTYGNKSMLLDLRPGRQSFRLWVSSHCSYVLQVFSDTPMTIGYLEEYLLACTAESHLLTNICYELSGCFGKVVQSFGMPEYSVSLRNFYHCYKPFENLAKTELVIVHDALFEEFGNVITRYSLPPNGLECARLLFLQLKTFDYINPYQEIPHWCPSELFRSDQVDYAKKMERAAVKLQAFFKGMYIRQLMKKHNESHKQYYEIFDTLKRVYNDIFSLEKRLIYCPKLLRNFFEREDMENLKEKFEIYRELESVMDNHIFANNLIVHEFGWVTICRYEFYVNCTYPIIIKINLFCNLKNYYVRVFDNDTETEIKRYTNNVAIEKYVSNNYGYTILCHGWAEGNTKINWKLILATKRRSRDDLIVIPATPIATVNLRDHYIPNFDNVICRYIIRVNSDAFLTAHLRTSYDQVNVCLKLMDGNKRTLRQTSGIGSALLPVLHLQCKDEINEISFRLSMQKHSRRRLTTQSGLSAITFSKLNKRYSSMESISSTNSGSQKKVSSGTDSQEYKRHKKRNASEVVEGDDDNTSHSSRHSEHHSHESSTKNMHARKSKGRQGDTSESDSVGERSTRKSSLKSKSSEKLNQRASQGKTRSASRQGILNKVVELRPSDYIIEGIVLNYSWPLTRDEWSRIQQLREKSYINVLTERTANLSKKSTNNKMTEEPFWVLDLVHTTEDEMEYEQDCSKSVKQKQLKMKWFEDKGRFRKGFELRQKYVEENLIPNNNFVMMNKDIVRSNDPKDFALNVVADPDIEKFMIVPSESVDEDICKTKRSHDYFINETNLERTFREYKGDQQAACEDTEELLQHQIRDFEIISQWFSEVRNDSTEMIAEAINLEKVYIKTFLETTKSKADKKSKEKKKK